MKMKRWKKQKKLLVVEKLIVVKITFEVKELVVVLAVVGLNALAG